MRGRGVGAQGIYKSSFLLVSKGVRSEGGLKLVCVCVLPGVGHPLVLLPVTSLFGRLYTCDGEQPIGTCLCVYLPYLGPGTHSWFGQFREGFFNFLKIYLPL